MKKMICRSLLVAICSLVLACSGNKDGTPLIEESKLVPLLVDVHIAEAVIQDAPVAAKDSVAEYWYTYIFKQHKVEKASFEATMKAFRKDPKRMEKLYAKVQEAMEEKR